MNDLLSITLDKRLAALGQAKKNGLKIVGYLPGNYVPEEILHAAGAVPLCLAKSGNAVSLDAARAVLPNVICPFARAQVGEWLLKDNPYYGLLDMLIVPITCQHLRKVAEIWEYYGGVEIFKLGIPHHFDGIAGLEYYTARLNVLKKRLEVLTENKITDDELSESINLYNEIRAGLKQISLMRRAFDSSLSSLDFVKMNQASLMADPSFIAKALEAVNNRHMEEKQTSGKDMPRLLLIGPNLSYGDYQVLELVDSAGGKIVIEDICEGVRDYWHAVGHAGDPLKSLAKTYLQDRIPCAFMHFSARKRLDFILNLIAEFHVSGVIWYQLINCETYDAESYYFARQMENRNIPMLVLESGYTGSDNGQLKARIDPFVELLKGGTVS